MSKKLLSEAVVRRFATLANLPAITEMRSSGFGMREDADEEIADDAAEAGMGELPVGDEAELEMDAGEEVEMDAGEDVEMEAGLGDREALAMDVIAAVADALNIEVDIEGGEAAEPDAEMDVGAAEDDMAAADDLDADAFADEEEAIMEALRGINYVPGKKEIVNEVAKRVARRLLKAKKAEQHLAEALGNRKPTKRRISRKAKK